MRISWSNLISKTRQWANLIKRDVIALWLAARDRRVPVMAKTNAAITAAYALSPIDLIPDFLPVVGYLDDLLIVPLGIWLAVRIIPTAIFADLRTQAAQIVNRPVSRAGMIGVIAIWTLSGILLIKILM